MPSAGRRQLGFGRADPGGWIDPIAWSDTQLRQTDHELVTTQTYGIADDVLAELDKALLTVVHRRARPHRGNHLVSSRCHLPSALPTSGAR